MILSTYAEFRWMFKASSTLALDGFPVFNYAKVSSTKLTLPTTPTVSTPIVVTQNGGANDAVANVDEWHWYLSQQSDDLTKAYWYPIPNALSYYTSVPTPTTATQSGTLQIYQSASGVAAYAASPTPETLFRLAFDVVVYGLRVSDGTIFVGDLGRSMFARY